MAEPVVVTGVGAVSPAGPTAGDLWSAVRSGRSCTSVAARFPTTPGGPTAVAVVPGREADPGDDSLAVEYAVTAAGEALASAGLAAGDVELAIVSNHGERRIPAVEGTGVVADTDDVVQAVRAAVGAADGFGVYGACAGGAMAIAMGVELLRAGVASVVLAGGVDCLVRDLDFTQFASLRVLSSHADVATACRPFDAHRDGFVLAEGAGFLVLETSAHAEGRGARRLGAVLGVGSCQGAASMVGSDAAGQYAAAAIRAALADAGLGPEDVGYVNAHGTATRDNDESEAAAILAALGEHGSRVPVSSTKSYLGHPMGAAGALEAIICLRALDEGLLPATGGVTEVAFGINVLTEPVAADPGVVLSNSFGFGGHNVVLALGR